jgi:hypothetical protein
MSLEEMAREKGCDRLMLTNAKQRQSYKRSFYHKCGWREREEIANFVLVLKDE